MTTNPEIIHENSHISRQAISSLASQAALRSYGVVGMAARGFFESWMHPTAKDPRQGVDVMVKDGRLCLDVYIIVEYGTRISTVADSVAHSVRYTVEHTLDLPVEAVNVHVQGLRVSDTD
jgi:uncharacterized alkaline shock family protein YloU